MNRRSITTRVARGAKLLDMYAPGWLKKVDTSALNIGNGSTCMLGQAFGEFSNGIRTLAKTAIKGSGLRFDDNYGYGDARVDDIALDAPYYGFDVADGSENESQEYDLLGEAWKTEIATRQAFAKRSAAARKGARRRAAKRRSR
jgi:hypothetical protein